MFESPARQEFPQESSVAGNNNEAELERQLQSLLDDPDNAFLSENASNKDIIDNAETAGEALRYAREKIQQRLERTFSFRLVKEIEGVEMLSVSPAGVKHMIESVKKHQEKIGEGGDAIVVIDTSVVRELPPEVCFKFAKEEKTPRGRNSLLRELEIQSAFYDAAEEIEGTKIGVPLPLYSTEIGSDKLIAMERLPAKSVDDIKRGFGSVPEWFDIDHFCDELGDFVARMHNHGLYHRDMHIGNVMIRQSREVPEDGKWGYVIDFGLSTEAGINELDPYKKEVAGEVFTYREDHDIIKEVRSVLKSKKGG